MSNPIPTTTSDSSNSVFNGSEPFFGFFSQAQVALQTLRLSLDGRIVAQTSDLASQMENTRRVLQHHGKFPDTIQDVLRIANLLQQRVQSWDREVQNIERSKQSKSGTHLQQLRSEIAAVRSKSHITERILSKLEIVLHQLDADQAERLASEVKSAQTTIETNADSEEIESVIVQVDEAIRDLVGGGLALDLDAVPESAQGSALQETAWDESLLLVVAQRKCLSMQGEEQDYQSHGSNRSHGKLWMIPKFLDIAIHIEAIALNLRLDWVTADRRAPVEWHLVTQSVDDWPRSQSVLYMVDKLITNRFDKDRTKLVAIVASVPADWSDHGDIHIEIRPSSTGAIS